MNIHTRDLRKVNKHIFEKNYDATITIHFFYSTVTRIFMNDNLHHNVPMINFKQISELA